MDDYQESAAEFAALNEPAKKRVYTEVANDLRDVTSVPLDKIAPHVLTRLAMTRHHDKLFDTVSEYYLDEKADPTFQRLTQCFYKPAPVEKAKTREIEPDDPSKREESDKSEQPSEPRVLGGDRSTSWSRPAGGQRAALGMQTSLRRLLLTSLPPLLPCGHVEPGGPDLDVTCEGAGGLHEARVHVPRRPAHGRVPSHPEQVEPEGGSEDLGGRRVRPAEGDHSPDYKTGR
jgi:hypothetical protein